MAKLKNGKLLLTAGGQVKCECCGCGTCASISTCPICTGCTPTSWRVVLDSIELNTSCCAISGQGGRKAQTAAVDGEFCATQAGDCTWEYDGSGEGVFDVYPTGEDCVTGGPQAQGDFEITVTRISGGIRVLIVSDGVIIFDGTKTGLADGDGCNETHVIANDLTAFVCDYLDAGALRGGKNGTVTISPCC